MNKLIIVLICAMVAHSSMAQRNKYIQGQVFNKVSKIKKNGIPNVLVTDGYNVSITDNQGYYHFTKNSKAKFVYITIPTGYQIPTNKSLPKFYQKIQSDRSIYDFGLEKEYLNDNHHILIIGADPQPSSSEDGQKWLNFAEKYFPPILNQYPTLPKVGIMCGDIVGDKLELYANHKKVISKIGIPFFQVLGNHDEDYYARTDERSQDSFRESFGPEYYSFNKGKIHYIVLDDVFYLGHDQSYMGYLNEQQFEWLEKDLKYVPKGSTLIIAMHIPPAYDTSKIVGEDAQDMLGGFGITNYQHLSELLAPYKVHFMSGHTHWNSTFQTGNFTHHIHGAICGSWWSSADVSFDGTPIGFGVYEIIGDSVKWYYQSAGMSQNNQMRLSLTSDKKNLIANIWNWDLKWDVKWYENGQYKGELQRYAGYDPYMLDYYNSLPNGHYWMKPTLTSHLFKTPISITKGILMVIASDRFHHKYIDSLIIR